MAMQSLTSLTFLVLIVFSVAMTLPSQSAGQKCEKTLPIISGYCDPLSCRETCSHGYKNGVGHCDPIKLCVCVYDC
ncbi:hypothetical protein ACHQM5_004076 [Ranunculus cassubicifolius]